MTTYLPLILLVVLLGVIFWGVHRNKPRKHHDLTDMFSLFDKHK